MTRALFCGGWTAFCLFLGYVAPHPQSYGRNWGLECKAWVERRAAEDVAFYTGRDEQRAEQARALFKRVRREGCGLP